MKKKRNLILVILLFLFILFLLFVVFFSFFSSKKQPSSEGKKVVSNNKAYYHCIKSLSDEKVYFDIPYQVEEDYRFMVNLEDEIIPSGYVVKIHFKEYEDYQKYKVILEEENKRYEGKIVEDEENLILTVSKNGIQGGYTKFDLMYLSYLTKEGYSCFDHD